VNATTYDAVSVGEERTKEFPALTRTMFVKYAGASGDFNPMHHDDTIATQVGNPSVFGHGMLSMGLAARVLKDWFGAESLRRLQVDCIDLYQSHWDDENTPLDETLGAYEQLMRQGKVRAIGASNYSTARLEQALDTAKARDLPRYQTLQPLYNLYDRDTFEGELKNLCARENIGVITYFSLAAGFLTGKYRSATDFGKSARGPGMKKYLNPRGLKILDALDEIARRCNATPAQISLAWLMARPGVTAPIASATNLAQLDELLRATTLKLDPEAMLALERASA